jgi:hypothetical protein
MKEPTRTTVNQKNYSLYKRWPLGCLLFLVFACTSPSSKNTTETENFKKIDSVKQYLKSGDLIFRNGNDDVSRAARSFNRIDTTYSHCGIIWVENDSIIVYHALGGIYNPGNKLRRDALDSFCSPAESDKFAVYRYPLTNQQTDSLHKIVTNYYSQGLPFDMYFNFLTDDKMYCSEFVFKSFNKAMKGKLNTVITAREWPYGISPDDLYLYEDSRLVKRVDFK